MMSTSWSGRRTRRPQDHAAQAAQDGAVAAFLDLDTRQSYVNDALEALAEDPAAGHGAAREWEPIKQRCFQASTSYLSVAESHSLVDAADHRTGVDPADATSAFTQVHRALAEAAEAVDTFYRRHAAELERARSLRAATPKISADARAAALAAETELAAAERGGYAYPSVQATAGELAEALSALKTADTIGSPLEVRRAAAGVHAASATLLERLTTARTLLPSIRGSLSSVRTRIDAVTTRLESLPATRSALLREFSAACSSDLDGSDVRARQSLEQARVDWAAAQASFTAGQPEAAASRLAAARSALSVAESQGDAVVERLRVLRATRADPAAAAKATRFTLRDAQLLVVDRGLTAQWGSVLDAQAARIERAAAELTGPHPDYWSYLQTLKSVEAFVRSVIDRVRGAAR